MSTATEPKTASGKTLVPPEEQFWKRYSPHHEAPLSGVSSLALHLLAIPLLILMVWVIDKLREEDKAKKMQDDPVAMDVEKIEALIHRGQGGGGGNTDGQGKNQGGDTQGERGEDPKPTPRPAAQRVNLPTQRTNQLVMDFKDDPDFKRYLGDATPAVEALVNLDKDIRDQLRKNVNPGVGQGGEGRDGGRDKGKDIGKDNKTGPAEGQSASLSQREKRVLRWAMTFNTQNGVDYQKQLAGLGAIVAFPLAENRFKVMHDLLNPNAAAEEDISKINRIYWVDDKPQSVRSLSSALNQQAPPFFVAFFPLELEKELLEIELAFMKKRFGRAKEDDIHETKFDVYRVGTAYKVRVRDVYLKR